MPWDLSHDKRSTLVLNPLLEFVLYSALLLFAHGYSATHSFFATLGDMRAMHEVHRGTGAPLWTCCKYL